MKYLKLTMTILLFVAAIGTSAIPANAIGTWKSGTVTRAPWQDKRVRIEIDDVTYILMKDIKISEVSHSGGSTSKKLIPLYRINLGNKMIFMAEGNRIYQIEKEH